MNSIEKSGSRHRGAGGFAWPAAWRQFAGVAEALDVESPGPHRAHVAPIVQRHFPTRIRVRSTKTVASPARSSSPSPATAPDAFVAATTSFTRAG